MIWYQGGRKQQAAHESMPTTRLVLELERIKEMVRCMDLETEGPRQRQEQAMLVLIVAKHG